MPGSTPSQNIPYAEKMDPFELTQDLRGSFNKIDSVFAQTRGESVAALSSATAAQVAAGQALARVNTIEDPIHEGPSEPTGGEALWLDTDADAPPSPGGAVTSADITDATDLGRTLLTSQWSSEARNALSIFTGTRALLDAGTDTAERTWDAKELNEFVTETAESAGGAASWDDLTGKPATFPPSTHTHDDRYYTQAEVLAKIATATSSPLLYRSGTRDIASTLLPNWTPRTSGVQIMRDGFTVTLIIDIARTGSNLTSFAEVVPIPDGFRPIQPGYIGPWSAGTVTGWWDRAAVEAALRLRDLANPTGGAGTFAVGTRLRTTVSWQTADPIPATLPGTPA